MTMINYECPTQDSLNNHELLAKAAGDAQEGLRGVIVDKFEFL